MLRTGLGSTCHSTYFILNGKRQFSKPISHQIKRSFVTIVAAQECAVKTITQNRDYSSAESAMESVRSAERAATKTLLARPFDALPLQHFVWF